MWEKLLNQEEISFLVYLSVLTVDRAVSNVIPAKMVQDLYKFAVSSSYPSTLVVKERAFITCLECCLYRKLILRGLTCTAALTRRVHFVQLSTRLQISDLTNKRFSVVEVLTYK